MGLFSMSEIYFCPSFYFFPQMGELKLREGLSHMSFSVLVLAKLICLQKLNQEHLHCPLLRLSRETLN